VPLAASSHTGLTPPASAGSLARTLGRAGGIAVAPRFECKPLALGLPTRLGTKLGAAPVALDELAVLELSSCYGSACRSRVAALTAFGLRGWRPVQSRSTLREPLQVSGGHSKLLAVNAPLLGTVSGAASCREPASSCQQLAASSWGKLLVACRSVQGAHSPAAVIGASSARPNHSLNLTRCGSRRLAAPGHGGHRPSAASRRLPQRAG
jgi:hypothetical protein